MNEWIYEYINWIVSHRELKIGGWLQVTGELILAAMVEAGLSEEVTSEQGQKDEKEGHRSGAGRKHSRVREQQVQRPWGQDSVFVWGPARKLVWLEWWYRLGQRHSYREGRQWDPSLRGTGKIETLGMKKGDTGYATSQLYDLEEMTEFVSLSTQ